MAMIRIEIRINNSKPDDLALLHIINDLKAIRALSQTIRDGIWLMVDLRAGRTTVLFNLFPHLRTSFVQDVVQYKVPSKSIYSMELLDKLAKVAVEMMRPAAFFNRPY